MVDVQGLSKSFGDLPAVRDLSFSVQPGEILGFLGPNGAGKSTTMKMLTGYWEPSRGTARIAGFDILRDSVRARESIGYLPESAPFYGEMTVCEFLTFIAEMRSLRGAERERATATVRESCFLTEVWNQPIETLSKGYRQRVGLAQALIHNPPVLILDEPTDGLDPNQKHEVRTLIRRIASQKTIILSTHILEEVEALCTRITILAKGELKADAAPSALLQTSERYGEITVSFKGGFAGDARAVFEALPSVARVDVVSTNTLQVIPRGTGTERKHAFEAVLSACRDRRWELLEFWVNPGSFEDVFRRLTLPVEAA